MSGEQTDAAALYAGIREEIGRVVVGNEEAIEGLTIATLIRGHVLLEGVPGIAKTTIASCFARVTGLEHSRIQMTPDLLPADITGTNVYREETGEFVLHRGPIFANVVVADEINRATSKTQSALLEAMAERTVTIGGETLSLPEPFLVIATQNPIEMEGVFELPEAQRDRFRLKITIELPARENERAMLDRFDADPVLGPDQIEQTVDPSDLIAAREAVAGVHVAEPVKEYILDLVAATRAHSDVRHGGSPRASLSLLDAGKARAAIRGREYAIPDDIKGIAESVFVHRLVLDTEAELGGVTPGEIVEDVLGSVDVPNGETAVADAGTSLQQ